MTVHFIGAGPGAADLITVRGRDLLARCEICLYPGSMTPTELLAYCPPEAQRIDTANLNLDEIIERLVAAHLAGHDVARLCSGDPSLYSAVAEQMRRLDAAGVPYEVTPGVPAFAAAAAVNRQRRGVAADEADAALHAGHERYETLRRSYRRQAVQLRLR